MNNSSQKMLKEINMKCPHSSKFKITDALYKKLC